MIDSGCATIAEVRKRGAEFWDEFDHYLSDIIVGIVLDAVLVTLIAPRGIYRGTPLPKKRGVTQAIMRWSRRLPAASLQKSPVGSPFTLTDRMAGFVVKSLEYALAGILCGLVGQGLTNGMVVVKRQVLAEAATRRSKKNEAASRTKKGKQGKKGNMETVSKAHKKMPDPIMTGLVWGLFMATSSNVRYQIVFGIERLLEASVLRRSAPLLNAASIVVRFANNVIGGEQFIDYARWAKIQ